MLYSKERTETRQTNALHHLKWSISLFFLTQYVIGLLQRALEGKAWSTLQIISETSQAYTTVVYRDSNA